MQPQTKNNDARFKEQCILKKMHEMQFQIHWGICQTLRQRDIGHKSDIRTGKTRCGLYKHIRDFKDHDIDWENQIILDKDPDMFKRRIKEAVYIKANDDGYLMNPDKGCPINECWNEFNTLVKKNMRKH